MTSVLIQETQRRFDRYRGEGSVEIEAETGLMWSQAKEAMNAN